MSSPVLQSYVLNKLLDQILVKNVTVFFCLMSSGPIKV